LEILLDEDSHRTQEELAEGSCSLGVAQSIISMRLKALRMIQKQENWVLYELKPRNLERCFFMCEQLFQRQKRKDFLHRIITSNEKWILQQLKVKKVMG